MLKQEILRKDRYTVVKLSGYLDFGAAAPIAMSIRKLYQDANEMNLMIDLHELEFVGSSGVSSFVKSLRDFNGLKKKPLYCGVKSEFIRLFRLFEAETPFEIEGDKSFNAKAPL